MGRSRARTRRVWWWRWRHNPLRRGSDVAEGWVILITWTVAGALGCLAGVATADAVEGSMVRARAERHAVTAVLTENAPKSEVIGRSTDLSRVWASVSRRDAKGAPHSGSARVQPGGAAGTRVTVWTDADADRLLPEPVDPADARLSAALFGGPAGAGAVGAVLVAGHLGRRRLDRRRMAQWDAEWERTGPQWRKRAG
ncbi:hypothetical protein [Streptomyces sp. NPDC046939]|uniref:Rv1733c family protein n=1 Tax=Streptomyces sp. NPDC046939 TaxID=3155376 RepID=UPI0033DB81E0